MTLYFTISVLFSVTHSLSKSILKKIMIYKHRFEIYDYLVPVNDTYISTFKLWYKPNLVLYSKTSLCPFSAPLYTWLNFWLTELKTLQITFRMAFIVMHFLQSLNYTDTVTNGAFLINIENSFGTFLFTNSWDSWTS